MNNVKVSQDQIARLLGQGMDAYSVLKQLQQGSYGGNAKLRAWDHYFTVLLATGATEYDFFNKKVGADAVSQIGDTNNPLAGAVPNSTFFSFDCLEVAYIPNADTQSDAAAHDIAEFLERYISELTIENQSPEQQFPLCNTMGLTLPIKQLGVVGDNTSLRSPLKGQRYFEKVPVVLAALTNYTVKVKSNFATPATLNTDRLKLTYKGYKLSAN